MNKDRVIADLRDCVEEFGYNLNIVSTVGKVLEFSVLVAGTNIAVTYNISSKMYDIIPSSVSVVQSCKDLNEFRENFKNYVYVFSVFIPTTKLIAANYEERFIKQVVYTGTVGSKFKGFTSNFLSITKDIQLEVSCSKDEKVYYLKHKDFKGNEWVNSYLIDNGKPVLVYDVNMLTEDLRKRYESSKSVAIKQLSPVSFHVAIGKDFVRVTVSNDLDKLIFSLNELNTELIEGISFSLEDPSDMHSLIETSKAKWDKYVDSLLGGRTVEVSSLPDVPESVQEFEGELVSIANFIEGAIRKKEVSVDIVEEDLDDDVLDEEDLDDTMLDEEDLDDIVEVDDGYLTPSLNEDKDINDFYNSGENRFSLVVFDGVVKYLRYSTAFELYDIPIKISEDLGVPTMRVERVEIQSSHRGVKITQEELSRRLFSKVLSADDPLCRKIVDSFFD